MPTPTSDPSAPPAPGYSADESIDLNDEWHDPEDAIGPAPALAPEPVPSRRSNGAGYTGEAQAAASHSEDTPAAPSQEALVNHSEAPPEYVDATIEGHKADPAYYALWGARPSPESRTHLPTAEGSIYPFGQHRGVSSAFLPQASHVDLSQDAAGEKDRSSEDKPTRPYLHAPRRGSGAASIAPARPPSLFNQDAYTDLPGNVTIGPQAQAVPHTLRRRLFVPYPQMEVVLGSQGELLDYEEPDAAPRVAFEEDTMRAKPGRGVGYDFVHAIVLARRRKLEADVAGAADAAGARADAAERREAASAPDTEALTTIEGLGNYNASAMAGAETSGVLFDDALLDSPNLGSQSLMPELTTAAQGQDTQSAREHAEQADKALEQSLRDAGLVDKVPEAGPRKASELQPDDLFLPDPRPWKPLRWVRRTNPRQLMVYVAGTVLPPPAPVPGSAGKGMLPRGGARGGIGIVFSPPSETDPWGKYLSQREASGSTSSQTDTPSVQLTSPEGLGADLLDTIPAVHDRREADLARRLEAVPPGARATPQRAVLRAALAALEWQDWWRPSPAGAGAKAVVLAVAEAWVANGISDWIHGWRRDGWILSGAEGQRKLGPAGARVPDRDLWELLEAVVGQYEEAGCSVLFWVLPESTPGLVAARLAAAEGAARTKQQPALVRWRKKEAQNTGSQPIKGLPSSKPKPKKPASSAPPINPQVLSQGIGMALSASIAKNNPRAAKYLFR